MNKPSAKPHSRQLFAAAALVSTAILAGSTFFVIKSGKYTFNVPAYQVDQIVDGDTFITKEDHMIRIS